MAVSDEQGQALIDAVEVAIRPLLPLCRTYGVNHHDLSQMVARLFVYDTAETLKKEGRSTTLARLALMTGLTKGEVEKHLAARESATMRSSLKTSEALTPAVVLTLWHTDSRFTTPYGVALDLAIKAGAKGRSFEQLVESAVPGADVEIVLDQLVAAGCAEVIQDDSNAESFVRCTERSYIPRPVSSDRINGIGNSMSALAATLTHNVFNDTANGYFERWVQSDFPVSREGHRAIRSWLAAEGSHFIGTLDSWMNTNRATLESPSGHRVGLNIFMYDVPSEAAGASNIKVALNG